MKTNICYENLTISKMKMEMQLFQRLKRISHKNKLENLESKDLSPVLSVERVSVRKEFSMIICAVSGLRSFSCDQ